jgi:hypothetical protein
MSSIWSHNILTILSEIVKTIPLCLNCHGPLHCKIEEEETKKVQEELTKLHDDFWKFIAYDLFDHVVENVYDDISGKKRKSFLVKFCKYLAVDIPFYNFISKYAKDFLYHHGITEDYLLNCITLLHRSAPDISKIQFNFKKSTGDYFYDNKKLSIWLNDSDLY